jgi:hypothetical protein
MVNVGASMIATEMESIFASMGHAIHLQRQGVPGAQAWGSLLDLVGGITRTFGMNMDGTSRRVFDDTWAAFNKGTTRFRSDKLESLGELESHEAQPMLREQGRKFMDAWREPSGTKRTLKVAKEGALLAAKYVANYPMNLSLALAHTLTGNRAEAAQDLHRIVNNFIAERAMVTRFMLAADAVTSGFGTNTKLLLMQRTGELMGDPQFADKVFEDVVAEQREVLAREDAERAHRDHSPVDRLLGR